MIKEMTGKSRERKKKTKKAKERIEKAVKARKDKTRHKGSKEIK